MSNFPANIYPFVTGPALLTVGDLDLGYTERTPRILIRSGWLPYFNDFTGQIIPNDMVWSGKEAIVMADINAADPDGLAFCRTVIGEESEPNLGGDWSADSVGTMMTHEEQNYTLSIIFPYAGKEAYLGYPGGYDFTNAFLEGPEDLYILGTQPSKIHLVFRCLPKYDAGSHRFELFKVRQP